MVVLALPANYIRALDNSIRRQSLKMLAIQLCPFLNDGSIRSTIPAAKGEPHGCDQRGRPFQYPGERGLEKYTRLSASGTYPPCQSGHMTLLDAAETCLILVKRDG
jgi:hypothetical protein